MPGPFVVPSSGNNSQDRVSPMNESNQSSSSNEPMAVPLTSRAFRPTSELPNSETVCNLSERVNRFCFRSPWSKTISANQTYSSSDSETTSQIPTANTPDPRESSSNQAEASSGTRVQCSRSFAAERPCPNHTQTRTSQQYSSSDSQLTEFRASEEARFQTFKRWTSLSVARAWEFAHAGFIYVGPADRVQCVFCHGMVDLWESTDSPAGEHCWHFPRCRYVVGYLSDAKLAAPKHAKYRTEASRLLSFRAWDQRQNPKPAALAKAGFFYRGRKDWVICFCCNGGLGEWAPNDDPSVEHARWFPNCPFVKQSQVFISAVLHDRKPTKTPAASVGATQDRPFAQRHIRKIIDDKATTQMESLIITAVLRLDIPKKLVKKAIRQRLAKSGQDVTQETALLETAFGVSKKTGQDSATTKERKVTKHSAGASYTSKDLLLLAQENEKLKEQRLCKICLDDDACVAFIPCGHLVCSSCAPALALCPLCRAKISGTIRTYIS